MNNILKKGGKMKIVINIPNIKIRVRPWLDKMVQSLTYEPEENETEEVKKAEAEGEKKRRNKLTENELKNESDKQMEELFVPRKKSESKKVGKEDKYGVKKAMNATKIQIQTEDLHLISTALIRYKKHLAQNKQLDKAQRVGELDRMFYEVITQKTPSAGGFSTTKQSQPKPKDSKMKSQRQVASF